MADKISYLVRAMRAILKRNYIRTSIKKERIIPDPYAHNIYRGMLYTSEQMQEYAAALSHLHLTLSPYKPSLHILSRLHKNEQIIEKAYHALGQVDKHETKVDGAIEWLLDNHYLLKNNIIWLKQQNLKQDLARLPALRKGRNPAVPRIYDLAQSFISHTDLRFSPEDLLSFVETYQKTAPLELDELWAIPSMLRLSLIEGAAQISKTILDDLEDKQQAQKWTHLLLESHHHSIDSLIDSVNKINRAYPSPSPAFLSHIFSGLKVLGGPMDLPIAWINRKLASMGMTSERLTQLDLQKKEINKTLIGNCINSLRYIQTISWEEYIERISFVDQILRKDPANIYGFMHFQTRDIYRNTIHRLSKKSGMSEISIAQIAVRLAITGLQKADKRESHVGYYLVDDGYSALLKAIFNKTPLFEKIRLFFKKWALGLYIGSIFALTVLATYLSTYLTEISDVSLLFYIPLFVTHTYLTVALINWIFTSYTHPKPLPRMDLSGGIPVQAATMVTIPCLLINREKIDRLFENLEINYLNNKDRNLFFSLLTDFPDSSQQVRVTDQDLLHYAEAHISSLNQKYAQNEPHIFFLFHRDRVWAPKQGCFMGYERKRGKLSALNAYLKDRGDHHFSFCVGDTKSLPGIKYVITIDEDVYIPHDAAREMVSVIEHPLNKPIYDLNQNRTIKGYGILQPRMAIDFESGNQSFYSKLFSSDMGIDPYTRSVSDIYQDIFAEGSFVGKGIYDIDTFEMALKNRFPENRILSHDLIEGCFARSGLINDIILYEKIPSDFETDMKRRHRWVRGDIQILEWAFGHVPAQHEKRTKNPLTALSRWKIWDNVRRIFIPPIALLTLITGWFYSPHPWIWTSWFFVTVFICGFLSLGAHHFRTNRNASLYAQTVLLFRDMGQHILQTLFFIATLPYESFCNLHASCTAFYRLYKTKQNLLEWRPSSLLNQDKISSFKNAYRYLYGSPLFAAFIGILICITDMGSFPAALPFLTLWALSPAVIYLTSLRPKDSSFTDDQKHHLFFLKETRKIWGFFSTYVDDKNNYLPPDNVQTHPGFIIANRTSPTNIGLYLLSVASAHDLGYISIDTLIDRLSNTYDSLKKMDRYNGHFYNWYDTHTLSPLHPIYISTVDSGNFCVYLHIVKQAVLEYLNRPVLDMQTLASGLRTTIDLAYDGYKDAGKERLKEITDQIDLYNKHSIHSFFNHIIELDTQIKGFCADHPAEDHFWVLESIQQTQDIIHTVQSYFPWVADQKSAEWIKKYPEIDTEKTLIEITGSGTDVTDPDLLSYIHQSVQYASQQISRIQGIVSGSDDFADASFKFLYDKNRDLLCIGYNLSDRKLDNNHYDLLASEARLSAYYAVAKGDIPPSSWAKLSRPVSTDNYHAWLLSWSGSMFEYLMPLLVMPAYPRTLLSTSYRKAVEKQIEQGKRKKTPWGVSESCYYIFDAYNNYQYRAFGTSELKIKEKDDTEHVIAPYASVMACMVQADEAYKNMRLMQEKGYANKFGFYESIDYTPSRLPPHQKESIIYTHMAHHQGMSFAAMMNVIRGGIIQKRFLSVTMFKAHILFLQEKEKVCIPSYKKQPIISSHGSPFSNENKAIRFLSTPHLKSPEIQLLSNGKMHVGITHTGGGYTKIDDTYLSRWRPDITKNNWGTYFYIKDIDSGDMWSSTYQPTLKEPDIYEVYLSEDSVQFVRYDHDIETIQTIFLSPDDPTEIRHINIKNHSSSYRRIEITSYSEVTLSTLAADSAHPAFNSLFVETDIRKEDQSILFYRRPRDTEQEYPYMYHQIISDDIDNDFLQYETNRAYFIGRGNDLVYPVSIDTPLTFSDGAVLDPIASIRTHLDIPPGDEINLYFLTGACKTKQEYTDRIDKYSNTSTLRTLPHQAWLLSQVMLRRMNMSDTDALQYSRMAMPVIYKRRQVRKEPMYNRPYTGSQDTLWSASISGDHPIILVDIYSPDELSSVRQIIQAHMYWRSKGVIADLVIIDNESTGYRQSIRDSIYEIMACYAANIPTDVPGGIYIRSGSIISDSMRHILNTIAVIKIDKDSESPFTLRDPRPYQPSVIKQIPPRNTFLPVLKENTDSLRFYNGIGGFSESGHEYIITVSKNQIPPMPWVNVIANKHIGTVVSDLGQSYTFHGNAHAYRITPWNNDPLSKSASEAIYIKDQKSKTYWSATPGPSNIESVYKIRHGFGYSVFETTQNDIQSILSVYVSDQESIKYYVLDIQNISAHNKSISVTGYVEWVLGTLREQTYQHIETVIDPETGAIIAYNPFQMDYKKRFSFFDSDGHQKKYICKRSDFIGYNGTHSHPQALKDGITAADFNDITDPCAVIDLTFELSSNEHKQIVFRIGSFDSSEEDISSIPKDLIAYIKDQKGVSKAYDSFNFVKKKWEERLSPLVIETGDLAFDTLANGWLSYQTLSSRLFAKSGFYQSGGAVGFRDQLQDTMALVHVDPAYLKNQILLSARHQFMKGDVLHWWHPHNERGVRTKCSDDYLWLPYAVARYIDYTGDYSILSEHLPYIEGPELAAHEESKYDFYPTTHETETLYDHCKRALLYGFKYGAHGLPLIGTCDWNDAMSKVGMDGKGESVWLGFFIIYVVNEFTSLSEHEKDTDFLNQCKKEVETLTANLNTHGWDGNWYRRAYFDDGTPLGSALNDECKIDVLSQSWAILSGAGDPEKIKSALNAAEQYLVDKDSKIIKLLTPPFHVSDPDPGYIRSYVPGVRENGGQYTHAAIWLAMAYTFLQDGNKAWEILKYINPIHHSDSYNEMQKYMVEPYVLAADVYSENPHKGRGGWTWYTGSSGWMYRLMIEHVLGIKRQGDKLFITPCLPDHIRTYKVQYQYRKTTYHICVHIQDEKYKRMVLDRKTLSDPWLPLIDDEYTHQVDIYL